MIQNVGLGVRREPTAKDSDFKVETLTEHETFEVDRDS